MTDTGIGIKPDDLPRLFQEFVRLDAAMTRHIEGTGLGLVLTKRLVELHGGTIAVASDGEGRGSAFTVRLPLTVLSVPTDPAASRRQGIPDTPDRRGSGSGVES